MVAAFVVTLFKCSFEFFTINYCNWCYIYYALLWLGHINKFQLETKFHADFNQFPIQTFYGSCGRRPWKVYKLGKKEH